MKRILENLKRKRKLKRIKYWRKFLFTCQSATKESAIHYQIDKHFPYTGRTLTESSQWMDYRANMFTENGDRYIGYGKSRLEALKDLALSIYLEKINPLNQ